MTMHILSINSQASPYHRAVSAVSSSNAHMNRERLISQDIVQQE